VSSAVFYISGHGFGHASREIEIIHALAARRPEWQIVLRTAVSPSLLERSLRVPFTLLAGVCDTGVVQRDSVTNDDVATRRDALAFYSTMDVRVDEECARLAPLDVQVIVGDIPPLAFEVAARLGVPSVAIANFTWDWIYEWQDGLRDSPALLDRIRRGYQQATIALRLPLSPVLDVFPRVESIPLVARTAETPRSATRAALGIPHDRKVALLSFGGYGLQRLDVGALDCLNDWTVLLTDRISSSVAPSPSILFLPESLFASGFRYEDLVAASDAVVTKPGYGIIGECATSGTAMLYTSRGHFREYDVLVAEMPRILRCRYLSQEALFAGQWKAALEALIAQPPPPVRVDATGAARAAEVIERSCFS
jgi:L-arabinokinase